MQDKVKEEIKLFLSIRAKVVVAFTVLIVIGIE